MTNENQSPEHTASAALRSRCWPAHQRLESHPVAQRLVSDALTPHQYAHILNLWYLAWLPLEQLVAAHPPLDASGSYWPARRAHLAEQDLTYLGYPVPRCISPPAQLPHAHGIRWYGLTYVMQGSALGGQVIAAHLHRLLGLQAGLGASFFAAAHPATPVEPLLRHRPSVRQDWAAWTKWLDHQLAGQPESLEAVVETASATFDYLYDAFSSEPDLTTGA